MNRIKLLSVATALFTHQATYAIDDSEGISKIALYEAVDTLTNYYEEDVSELAKVTKKTAVVHYTQTDELPLTLRPYVLKKISFASKKNTQRPVTFVNCIDCNAIRAEAKGDEVFIKKGITNQDELDKTLKDNGLRNYSEVHLAYTGKYLTMQMGVYNKDNILEWSREYKTPYNIYQDSQYQLGLDVEGVNYMKDGFPSTRAGRAYIGQRIFGVGSAGLSATVYEKTKELSTIQTFGTYMELNHNQLFSTYWDSFRLNYLVELGVTDFNGRQQLASQLGVKTLMGNHFVIRVAMRNHRFMRTPKDDSDVFNPNGDPIIKNNESLPNQLVIGVGAELL